MALAPASRLGPYEILAPLGAGGMGEVYRARDTRLDRIVAIKVLPSHVADRPDLRQRFEREARAVSSLNHPHICILYDIGRQDEIDYLVMEYLEGETLARRLEKGPLPPDQVLRYAAQIAHALGQAHRQGVFHRDLKPGNIMLTKLGAKLLDFGLAKLKTSEIVGGTVLTLARLPESTLTTEGMVLGTFHYMPPEQLEAKETDGRSDIFSFGCVLHEMLTGQKAFQGDTAASVIAAILSSEPPPVTTLQPSLAARRPQGLALDRIVRKSLAKSPDERWQTAQDLASELAWLAESASHPGAETPEPAPASAAPVARATKREWLAWTGLALATAAALVLGFLYVRKPSAPIRPTRLFFAPPERTTLAGSIAVSPDGRHLAFVTTTPQGGSALWVRPLDSITARALPETEGALHPFWSPNSQFLGFFADKKLKKIRVEGGPPQTLGTVFDARGGTWNRHGIILYAPNVGDRLYQIPEGGGAPAPVTSLNQSRQESSHQWPYFLPDGRRFLYLVWSAQAEARGIYLGSLDGQPARRVMPSDWGVVQVPDDSGGSLLFLRGRTLMRQSFDPNSARLSGEPAPIAEQVWYDETTPGLTSFSVSETGVLAYRSGGVRSTQLTWHDRAGRVLGTVGPPGAFRDPCLSPEGRRLVVSRTDPQTGTLDVWMMDLTREVPSRFTFHPLDEGTPLWSPDGTEILFFSNRDGGPNLHKKAASGAAAEDVVLSSNVSKYPTSWSRDGKYIIYANWDPKPKWDLWILPLQPQSKPFPYLQTDFDTFQAQFSPDSRWISYTSNESNRYQIYVQPFQGKAASGSKWPISTEGGSQASWRQDGRELYYIAADRKLMVVEIKPGATFDPGAPRALFQTQVPGLVDARNHYVASTDGQRFLINTITQESASWPVTVVLNWEQR